MSDKHSYVDALKAEIDRHETGWVAEYEAVVAENDRLREERDKFHDALEKIAAGDFAELATENDRLREALFRIELLPDFAPVQSAKSIASKVLAKEETT